MTVNHDNLKEYYGKILSSTRDLKTSACCCSEDSLPPYQREIIANIEDEILDKFYGCGSPIPYALNGMTVLDLGCGTGRDVYIVSKLVGESGAVIGIDMTDEQLQVANKYIDSQTKRFGFQKPNVVFKKGYIEDLEGAGIPDNSVDVVISNCVINLSPNKEAVFSEIYRVLKPGGELYISDVFSGRRIPEKFLDDALLHGECLAGAMYIEDFRRMVQKIGFIDYRNITLSVIQLDDPEVYAKVGMIDFYSITVRAFKLSTLEDICEDYGQVATYLGTMPESPHYFDLDDHHRFYKGKPHLVCGNTASMLEETRFGKHFKITGDRSVHFGPFDCHPALSSSPGDSCNTGGSCC